MLLIFDERAVGSGRCGRSEAVPHWGVSGGVVDSPRRGKSLSLILDERLEIAPAQRMPELPQRLRLDLPDALAGHGEPLADFLECVLALFADPEAQAQDLLFLGAERRERTLHLVRQILRQKRLVGR